jgi:hypothetical protein
MMSGKHVISICEKADSDNTMKDRRTMGHKLDTMLGKHVISVRDDLNVMMMPGKHMISVRGR